MEIEKYKGESLFLLRLVLAFIFLWHGIPKAFNIEMAMSKFVSMGFPGFLGPIIGWVEVIGGILLLVGMYTKLTSLILGIVIAVAIIFVHLQNGVTAGIERDLMIVVGFIVLAAFGPGKFAKEKRK